MFLDFSTLTTGRFDVITETFIAGPGVTARTFTTKLIDIDRTLLPIYDPKTGNPSDPYPCSTTAGFFVVNMVIYAVLTWFFDNVIPDEFGNSKPIYFFLMPSYWVTKKRSKKELKTWMEVAKAKEGEVFTDEDSEVAKERNIAMDSQTDASLRIINLRKVYRNSLFRKSAYDKVAVKNLCLGMEEGKW